MDHRNTPTENANVGKTNIGKPSKNGSPAVRSEMRQLPVGLLEIDYSYRQNLIMRRVKYIADHFNPDLLGVIKVSFRDGHYYVVDGCHTVAAIKEKFHDDSYPLLCKVYHGLTVQDEARMTINRAVPLRNYFAAKAHFDGDTSFKTLDEAFERVKAILKENEEV